MKHPALRTWILVIAFSVLVTASCASVTTANLSNMTTNVAAMGAGNTEPVAKAFKALREILTSQLKANYMMPPQYYDSFGDVHVSYEPLQVIDLDEVLQSITISSAITLSWRNPDIGWNPQNFTGIEWMVLPSELVWLPSIIVPKTSVKKETLSMPDHVRVSYQGFIVAFIPTITNTMCNLNLEDFPFDKQDCYLVLVEADQYNMTSGTGNFGDIGKYLGTNAAWILISHECHPEVTEGAAYNSSYVSCHIEMRRRSVFYVVNLLLPMAVTSLMTLLVFCIPAEGGEKVSFILSIYMSTSMFYQYIIDMTPRSMERLPRVNILLLAIALQIILATAFTALSLIRHNKTLAERHQHHEGTCCCRYSKKRHGSKSQAKGPRNKFEDSRTSGTRKTEANQENVVSHVCPRDYGNNVHDDVQHSRNETDLEGNRKAESVAEQRLPYMAAINIHLANRNTKDINSERTENLINVDPPPRRLTYKELDMWFFSLMSVFTIVLYLSLFLPDI